MARSRSHTRRSARANPRGVLSVHGGGYGFVQTSEGEFFVPASKMGGAFDGDVVELAALPQERRRGSGGGRKGALAELRQGSGLTARHARRPARGRSSHHRGRGPLLARETMID